MMPLTPIARCETARRGAAVSICVVAAVVLSGCGTLADRRQAKNKAPANALEAIGMTQSGPSGIEGPTERRLKAERWNRERQLRSDPKMAAALADYDAAKKLYDTGHYKEAEKAFEKLSKKRRQTYESFGDRLRSMFGYKDEFDPELITNYGDPVEEDSMFMLAECQFRQRRYSSAQDSYDALLEKYPSTRHMEDSTHRLLSIAMYWLNYSAESDLNGDIQLAGGAKINPLKPPKAPSTPRIPIIPNLADRTRPVGRCRRCGRCGCMTPPAISRMTHSWCRPITICGPAISSRQRACTSCCGNNTPTARTSRTPTSWAPT
jgi:hypothetical protein